VLFGGVNDNSRQIQDLEIDPDGKLWIGRFAGGYQQFPLSGGFTPELTIYNNGQAGGFEFGPDRNGDGKPELYASADGTLSNIGYYDYETGSQLGTLVSDEEIENYSLTFGADQNGDGTPDLHVLNYYDRIRIYDGVSGAKIGETNVGLPLISASSLAPKPFYFLRWELDGVDQPIGQQTINVSAADDATAIAVFTSDNWAVDANGQWSDSDNWSGPSVPNDVGNTVTFPDVISGVRLITLDQNATAGSLSFDSLSTYAIFDATGSFTLTLDDDGTSSTIEVNRGSHHIVNGLTLQDHLQVQVATGASLALGDVDSSNPSLGQSLTKTGDGDLTLNGAAPDVVLDAGELFIASTGLVQNLTIGPGATAILNGPVMGDLVNNSTIVVSGDLNMNGSINAEDIDLLQAQLNGVVPEVHPRFDLVADGVIDRRDVDHLVQEILVREYGDADLDGYVDGYDFGVWNAHRFTTETGWASGDFNGDSVTDVRDFNLWNSSKFSLSSQSADLPLPVEAESLRTPRAALEQRVDAALAKPTVYVGFTGGVARHAEPSTVKVDDQTAAPVTSSSRGQAIQTFTRQFAIHDRALDGFLQSGLVRRSGLGDRHETKDKWVPDNLAEHDLTPDVGLD